MSGLCASALSLGQWADIAQIVAGLAAAVAALAIFFAWLSYKGQAKDSRTALLTDMSRYMNEVGTAFIEYPEMRQYFHDGREPDDADRPRAEAIAISLANAMDFAISHFDAIEDEEKSAWESYFDHVLTRSPVLSEYLKTRKDWYSPPLQRRIERLEA